MCRLWTYINCMSGGLNFISIWIYLCLETKSKKLIILLNLMQLYRYIIYVALILTKRYNYCFNIFKFGLTIVKEYKYGLCILQTDKILNTK